MKKDMKLRCRVADKDQTGRYTCTAKMFDGTPFVVSVYEYEVQVQGEFDEETNQVDGWIYCVQEGQQADRVAISLPQSSDVHGKSVTVHETSLLPRHHSIEDFKPKKA